jgi:small GTP-binding protein
VIQKKVCMLGSFAVGKTSLVRRFVEGRYDERYLTTVGVKIDRRDVDVDGREVRLVLWDIHGEDDLQKVRSSYLRGAAGCLLVVDGTRAATLDTALELRERARQGAGDPRCVLLLNKADLMSEWEISRETVMERVPSDCPVLDTSALSGEGVEVAFDMLARRLVAR